MNIYEKVEGLFDVIEMLLEIAETTFSIIRKNIGYMDSKDVYDFIEAKALLNKAHRVIRYMRIKFYD